MRQLDQARCTLCCSRSTVINRLRVFTGVRLTDGLAAWPGVSRTGPHWSVQTSFFISFGSPSQEEPNLGRIHDRDLDHARGSPRPLKLSLFCVDSTMRREPPHHLDRVKRRESERSFINGPRRPDSRSLLNRPAICAVIVTLNRLSGRLGRLASVAIESPMKILTNWVCRARGIAIAAVHTIWVTTGPCRFWCAASLRVTITVGIAVGLFNSEREYGRRPGDETAVRTHAVSHDLDDATATAVEWNQSRKSESFKGRGD